jgi:hypothetical protein
MKKKRFTETQIVSILTEYPRYGFKKLFQMIRAQGYRVNHIKHHTKSEQNLDQNNE